jgi:hypothetical protein
MPIEITKETHVVVEMKSENMKCVSCGRTDYERKPDEIAYLDASIDQLSDEDIEWINEGFDPSEENKSVPFKPLT